MTTIFGGLSPQYMTRATANIDPLWQSLWPNPPFQSYTSGHSTFSMAAATALAEFFGTDEVAFCATADPNAHTADNVSIAGMQRCFTSFTAAADEAGYSRIVGGIHFPSDNIEGLAAGKLIAGEVIANAFDPVPEPSSMAVLATVVTALAGLARRRASGVRGGLRFAVANR